jgi:hypothetical protein
MIEFNDELINDPSFWEFLNREFNDVAVGATAEELADFAFGSVENAEKAYRLRHG